MAERIILGAGCFWGIEEAFRPIAGVLQTQAGYAGGWAEHPSYEDVCAGTTGHAEVVELQFDPTIISLADLLNQFWAMLEPPLDADSQYRPIIICSTAAQLELALASKLAQQRLADLAIEIVQNLPFYPAEEYHQQCYSKWRTRFERRAKAV
ncbi:peptide-methionine (S)-S-oxide reductase MsrA [Herpetosiphon llansteffanensis]